MTHAGRLSCSPHGLRITFVSSVLSLLTSQCLYDVADLAHAPALITDAAIDGDQAARADASPDVKDASELSDVELVDVLNEASVSDANSNDASEGGSKVVDAAIDTLDGGIEADADAAPALPPRCLNPATVPAVFAAAQTEPYAIAAEAEGAYWTTRPVNAPASGVVRARRNGVMITLASAQNRPAKIALDAEYAYWANQDGNNIMRARKDGSSEPEQVAGAQNRPFGVAVDSQFVFWTNNSSGRVLRVETQTEAGVFALPTTLATDQTGVRDIALDATHVYFATDHGVLAKVAKTGAGVVSELVTPEALQNWFPGEDLNRLPIFGLALDSEFVYFRARALRVAPLQHDDGAVFRVSKNGDSLTLLTRDKRSGFSFLTVHQGRVYWPINLQAGEVWSIKTDGSSLTTLSCQQEANPTGVAAYDSAVYWTVNRGATIMRVAP